MEVEGAELAAIVAGAHPEQPLFARLREDHSPARTQEAYSLLSRFMLLLFCPAAAGLVVLAPNLTHIYDPKYSAAWPVVAVTAVCLFAGSALAVARNIVMIHEVYGPVIVSRLVGALSSPGSPLPFASGVDPAADTSESAAPPALVALPVAVFAYGPMLAPGVTVTRTSTLPLPPGASTSAPVSRFVFVRPS